MKTSGYIEVVFDDITNEQSGMLIAVLSNAGFVGFEEGEKQLKGYIKGADFNVVAFEEITGAHHLKYSINNIQSQNWNAVWEERFEPVIVDGFVGIRAHFHPSFAGKVQHEIVITPKMSFGTGHHGTTYMMIEQMQHLHLFNKQVLDFGTGTGILAILSEKLGAAHVLAIDIDEWSIQNAQENIARNNCQAISIQQADRIVVGTQYDVILANINKNVIVENLQQLKDCLADSGCLLISGLLTENEADILAATNKLGLKHRFTIHKQQWIAVLFAR